MSGVPHDCDEEELERSRDRAYTSLADAKSETGAAAWPPLRAYSPRTMVMCEVEYGTPSDRTFIMYPMGYP